MKPSGKKKIMRSLLPQFHLMGRRVFVRADGNVPLESGTITDDFRLQTLLPTLNLIKEHGGKIILATHIGRPSKPNPALSTKALVPWLTQHGFTVQHVPDLATAKKLSHALPEDILLLENLRFYPGEQAGDKKFARQLAALGDFYVNEAFGVSHRSDASIVLVPKEFTPEYRTMGLHFAQEIETLNMLKEKSAHPRVLIIGGGKVSEKLQNLLELLPLIDTVLLCPALVFTLMQAQGKPVGDSLIAQDAIPLAKKIIEHAKKQKVELVFPSDYQVALQSIDGSLQNITADSFMLDMIGIAIGINTIPHYKKIIENAGTVIFNGTMGFANRPETMQATYALLSAMATSSAYSLVGGGDSTAAAFASGAANDINFLSTGGGAMLVFLSSDPLPGLHALF